MHTVPAHFGQGSQGLRTNRYTRKGGEIVDHDINDTKSTKTEENTPPNRKIAFKQSHCSKTHNQYALYKVHGRLLGSCSHLMN